MNELGPRYGQIFLEVYEDLPRQRPGNRACAARALALCGDLPEYPAIVDLGCGVGGQTLQLAQLVGAGSIVAMDRHAPFIGQLRPGLPGHGMAG